MPGQNESVFEKISAKYYELTASEKKTADYVMSHQHATQSMSITELAEASGVADATVSRFCRRLGYGGYNAFKLAVANASAVASREEFALYGQVTESDSFEELCGKLYSADTSAISQTLELMNEDSIIRAVDILGGAEKVFCMGQGGSMILAADAAHAFEVLGNKFIPIADSHLQIIAASNMTRRDAILFFSYSGATREMMDTLATAKERDARVVLITRFPKAPGAAYADVILPCGTSESPLQMGSVAAKIAQLFIVDILFSELCRRNMEKSRENSERIATVLATKHL